MSTLRWGLLALAGVVVAIALTYAASNLSSQRIGLSSEPLTAGRQLVPPRLAPPAPSPSPSPTPRRRRTPTPTPTPTPAASPPAPAGGGEGERGDD